MNRRNSKTYKFFKRAASGVLRGADFIADGVLTGVSATGAFAIDAWHGIKDATVDNVTAVPEPNMPVTIDGTASVME